MLTRFVFDTLVGARPLHHWATSLAAVVDAANRKQYPDRTRGYEKALRVKSAHPYHPQLHINVLTAGPPEAAPQERTYGLWVNVLPSSAAGPLPAMGAQVTIDTPLLFMLGPLCIVYKDERSMDLHVVFLEIVA